MLDSDGNILGRVETKKEGKQVGTFVFVARRDYRFLERKLGAEETSFQDELQALRERLARDYLMKTRHTSAEISFLLGYEDPNSFTRAFHSWTGTTPEAHRSAAVH